MGWKEHIGDPEVPGGRPVVRGTHITVDFVIELLASGWSDDDIIRNYPGLTREDIEACRHVKMHDALARARLLHGKAFEKLVKLDEE